MDKREWGKVLFTDSLLIFTKATTDHYEARHSTKVLSSLMSTKILVMQRLDGMSPVLQHYDMYRSFLALNLERSIWMTSWVLMVEERRRFVGLPSGGVNSLFCRERERHHHSKSIIIIHTIHIILQGFVLSMKKKLSENPPCKISWSSGKLHISRKHG